MPDKPRKRLPANARTAEGAPAPRSSFTTLAMFLAIVGLLFLASLALVHARSNQVSAVTPGSLASTMKPIDGISCDSGEHSDYHVHAHLAIFVRGKPVTIPAGVGIPTDCYYWLHTHDDTGIIHIEAPRNSRPTLGQFYDIWGKKMPASLASMRVYVNLKRLRGDPRDIILRNHTDITLETGPPFRAPERFDFGAWGV
jgi:hypothetical protein